MSDPDRRAVYTAEDRLARWRRAPGPVTVFGSTWDVEDETRFTDVESVRAFVDRVCRARGLSPVRVRERRGAAKAHYEPGVIALPPLRIGGRWAMTLAVVLHELAHHAAPGHGHGPKFRAAYLDLLQACDQDVSARLLTFCYHQEGLTT